METKILKIVDIEADYKAIEEGASLIRNGELVAFPTETVYGLGAMPDARAVDKYTKPGRPGTTSYSSYSRFDDVKLLVKELAGTAEN